MKLLKHLHKRGLALFMALVLCLSLVQVTAFAEGEPISTDVITGEGGIQTEDDIQAGNNNQLEDDSHEHVWDDGEVTTPATCTAEGVKTFTCTVEGCGETRTEAISVIDHTPVTDARVEPTETETGLTEGVHCSVCNAVLTAQEVIPATGVVELEIPSEVQAFLDAVYALYDVPEELMLQAVEYAETLYNALTDEQKALPEVAQCKYGLDTFRKTMTLEETGVITVSGETALREAVAKGGTVKLGGDIQLSSTLEINQTVTLDLAGYALSLNATEGSVIKVTADGTVFTLIDSGENGIITGGKTSASGGGIFVDANAQFVMNGGNISGNAANINNNWDCGGGGVYIANGCLFRMTGGSILKNTAKVYGGGVYVDSNARFEMNGGNIAENSVQRKTDGTNRVWTCGGGGVYTADDSTFEMTGGTISKNASNITGAGVRADGIFIMQGTALITENTVQSRGGGVYVAGTFTMSGGCITKNEVGQNGAGVGVYVDSNGAHFEMRDAEISYNGLQKKAGLGGGVFFNWRSASEPVAFVMNEGAKIVGNYADSGGGVFLGGSTMVMNGGVISDNEVRDKGAGIYDNGLLTINGGNITNNRTNTTTSKLTEGRGGGVVIDSGVLRMHGGEISGNSSVAGGGVSIGDDCTFNNGTQLPSEDGYVRFEMTGGKICNNTARDYGGGVNVGCCDHSGTLIMSGGEISGNKVTAANGKGGGVYMFPGALFQMSETDGDSVIKTNTAALGGGVFADTTCNFTMSGGGINSNTAGEGGGVQVYGTFNMSNGVISNNTAYGWGGGVNNVGTFQMNGGAISGNKTVGEYCVGGGVANGQTGRVEIMAGSISDNVSDWDGGGIFNNSATVIMSGGSITGNSGDGDGGGIWNEFGTLTITGGEISGNKIKGNGGGVGVNGPNATFTMSGCRIFGNSAGICGGGVSNGFAISEGIEGPTCIHFGGKVTITDSEIHNNHAKVAGDDIWNDVGPYTHTDGTYYEPGSLSLGVDAATKGWILKDEGCGHVIDGWYYDGYRPVGDDSVDTTRWNFDDSTKDKYAEKWELDTSAQTIVIALKAAHSDPPIPAVTLRYDANGGSGAPGDQHTRAGEGGNTLSVSNGIPTRDGYTFLGWSTAPAGGVNYIGGNSITITADTTLYAVWEYNYVPYVPEFPTPTPTPTPTPVTPTPGTTITDEETPLGGSVGLNDTEHFAYVIGYDDDTVRPLNNITRAEAATIFFRLMTDEYRQANWSTANSFTDVNAGDWYNNAVSTCANAGVLKGYNDGTFRPNAPITRAEFASMAAGFMDESITDDGTGDFSDTANHWAAAAIRRAAKAGWVTGTGNKFNPDARITRAEVMTIVNRMLDRTPDKDHMLPTMKTWIDNPESEWYYEAVQEATNEHDYERDDLNVETWTELLTVRDWKALETEWANNGGASAPKADPEPVEADGEIE